MNLQLLVTPSGDTALVLNGEQIAVYDPSCDSACAHDMLHQTALSLSSALGLAVEEKEITPSNDDWNWGELQAEHCQKPEQATPPLLHQSSIQDWRVESGDDSLPESMKDKYQLSVTERSCGGLYFDIVKESDIDKPSTEQAILGLSGSIEIRNGRPAMSIGTSTDDLGLHIETIDNVIHIHNDACTMPDASTFHSDSHGTTFKSISFDMAL